MASTEVATRDRRTSPARRQSGATPGRRVVPGQVISRVDERAPKRPSASRQRVNRSGPSRPRGGASDRTRDYAQRAGEWGKGQVTGPHTGTLIAEYVLGVFFIFWSVFTSKDTYVNAMSTALWRMTALTAVFFILALLDHGGKPGKIAVAFGALIDLGIIYTATTQNVIKTMADEISGKGTGVTVTDALTSAGGSKEPTPILAQS